MKRITGYVTSRQTGLSMLHSWVNLETTWQHRISTASFRGFGTATQPKRLETFWYPRKRLSGSEVFPYGDACRMHPLLG